MVKKKDEKKDLTFLRNKYIQMLLIFIAGIVIGALI